MATSLADNGLALTQPSDGADIRALRKELIGRLADQGVSPDTARVEHWYWAVAKTIRDELLPEWEQSKKAWNESREKQAHLVSIEWLPGPHTYTALHSANLAAGMVAALQSLLPKDSGLTPQDIYGYEPDPGLGNGGLGRLMSCFILSAAFRHLPVMGYGICWEEGLFRQEIQDGRQVELPDNWKPNGNPWGVERTDRSYKVNFFGEYHSHGPDNHEWRNAVPVSLTAHDMMVPAFDGEGGRTWRGWQRNQKIRIETDNAEQYALIRMLTTQLYPSDRENFGKNLRFMQEYLLGSATVQDIFDCHLNRQHQPLDELPLKKVIQLNDTHPAIAIPETMRILVDEHHVSWDRARDMVRGMFRYTNHTLAPEALESWPRGIYRFILPRHEGIVDQLQKDLAQQVAIRVAERPEEEQQAFQKDVAIIVSNHGDHINDQFRSGHMALANTRKTNGVSDLHTELLRQMFARHLELFGDDLIVSLPNGISPVSWWVEANPKLAALITEKRGSDDWIGNLSLADGVLAQHQNDPVFLARLQEIKHEKKEELASLIHKLGGPSIDPDAMIDSQAKRFHGYKRQFLNIIGIVALYLDIFKNPDKERPKVVKLFAGKAAQDYVQAKDEIALVNTLADIINNDPRIGDKLKVFFMPNYSVSMAKTLFPAADLPEHISTAGWEAAGTSQAKPAGVEQLTRDGNNLKVIEKAGEDNCFVFGHTKQQLDGLTAEGYNPMDFIGKGGRYYQDDRLYETLVFIQKNTGFGHLTESIWKDDIRKIAADFVGNPKAGVVGYWESQEAARTAYMDPQAWLMKEIATLRALSHFSSNETLDGYAKVIWGIEPEKSPARPANDGIKQAIILAS